MNNRHIISTQSKLNILDTSEMYSQFLKTNVKIFLHLYTPAGQIKHQDDSI